MTKRLLVDAVHPEEVRVVLADESKLIEFEFESTQKKQLKSNIYLGKITRVEPSLQAAFVEYGGNRQGFLPFSEVHYDYFQIPTEDKEKIKKIIESESFRHDDEEEEDINLESSIQEHRDVSEPAASTLPEPTQIPFQSPQNEGINNEFVTTERSDKRDRGFRKNDRRDGGRRNNRRGDRDRKPRNFEDRPYIEIQPPFTEKDLKDLIRAEELARVFAFEYKSELVQNYPVQPEQPEQPEQQPEIIEEIQRFQYPEQEEQTNTNIEEINPSMENMESFDDEDTSIINEDRDRESSSMSRMDFYRQYKIQEVIKRNQVVLIQVVKEERGNKGASLTTYLALAGRYCVFMPNTEKGGGVSRRISSFSERRRIRTIVKDMELPKGSSIIVRTAGMERDESEIKNDYQYLMNLWDNIKKQTLESSAPALIYEESDIVKRSIRDLFKGDVEEVVIQGKEAYNTASGFVRLTSPNQIHLIKHHTASIPLFQKFRIEERLDELYEREVKLQSGGSIVISPTEALVSIDVNSGRATKERNIEDTAYKTNIEAAREIARQLRLRDLAGLIVIDFIDMRDVRNRKSVERELKESLRSDRAKIQIGRISTFGLLEMSRQRLHSSIVESTSICCEMCNGTGAVHSTESMGLKTIRAIEAEASKKSVAEIKVRVSPAIFSEITEKRKNSIQNIENNNNVRIILEEDVTLLPNKFEINTQKGQKKRGSDKGLSLEEFESLTPPDENEIVEQGNSQENTASKYSDEKGSGYVNQRGGNRRNRRKRDNRNHRHPQRFTSEANDNRYNGRGHRNENRDYDYNSQDNRKSRFTDEHDNQSHNIQNLHVEKSEDGDKQDKKSSKLMGLWKKITS